MISHSNKLDYFPPTKPTGWNQRNMQMPNKRWQIQRNQKRG